MEFIRARSDKREYRRVVLPNALECLLISDADTDKVCASPRRSHARAGDARGLNQFRVIYLAADISMFLAVLRRRRAWKSR